MRKTYLGLAFFAALLFACDFFSKSFISNHFDVFDRGDFSVFTNFLGIDFAIERVTNRGVAWGLLSSWELFLPFVRIAIIGVLVYVLVSRRHSRAKLFGLTSVIVGATGNVVDFFRFGHVVDFFHFIFWGYSFPVFNVADSAIFCGVVVLFYAAGGEKRKAVAE